MTDSVLVGAGYVDGRSLVRQFDEYCQVSELGNSFFAWKFLVLELWYRAFMNRGWVAA
jgi:hypothetical protein